MASKAKPTAGSRFFNLNGIELFTELSRIKSSFSSPADKGALTRWLKLEGSRSHLRSQFSSMDSTQEQAHRALFKSLTA